MVYLVDIIRIWISYSRRKKHLHFIQISKLSKNMQFEAVAVSYMANK